MDTRAILLQEQYSACASQHGCVKSGLRRAGLQAHIGRGMSLDWRTCLRPVAPALGLMLLATTGSAAAVLIVIVLSSPAFGGACAELGVDCHINRSTGPTYYSPPRPPREPTPSEKAGWLGNQAMRYADEGNWKAAEKKWRESINQEPTRWAYNNLGNALRQMRRYEEARSAFYEALRLEPRNAYAHYWLGWTYFDLHRYGEAEQNALKALEYGHDKYFVHDLLGHICEGMGQYERAEKEYLKAIKLNPKLEAARDDLKQLVRWQRQAKLNRAMQRQYDLLTQNKDQEAEHEARKYIATDRRHYQAHEYLGLALEKQGRVVETVQAYQDAIKADSQKATFAKEHLSALTSSGAYQQAVAAAQEGGTELSGCFDGAGPCAANGIAVSSANGSISIGSRSFAIPPALARDGQFNNLLQQKERLTGELKNLQKGFQSVKDQKASGGENKGALDLLEFHYKDAMTAKVSEVRTKELQIEEKVKQYLDLGFRE